MIKLTIPYTDYNGKAAKLVANFHLSRLEAIELIADTGFEDFEGYVASISDGKHTKELTELLKNIMLASYGVLDGARFVKTTEATEEFGASEAFSEMFVSMLEDPDEAKHFFENAIAKAAPKKAATGVKARKR